MIFGQNTLLSRTMHDIRYDEVHDEFLVTNPFAQAIVVFRGGADGNEKPLRVIQGPNTQLQRPDRLDVDPIHNEILVPGEDRILVYPRTANGDVAPIRVLRGPDTKLNTSTLAVDPVNNLIITSTGRGMQIFNRTDQGNVKPRAEIVGPNTGIVRINQLQVYSPKGWIIAAMPGGNGVEPEGIFVGVWSIRDNGNVAPRWKIAGPSSGMKKPRGVVLDVKHQELIVADMRLNSVLTYYFPEIF